MYLNASKTNVCELNEAIKGNFTYYSIQTNLVFIDKGYSCQGWKYFIPVNFIS